MNVCCTGAEAENKIALDIPSMCTVHADQINLRVFINLRDGENAISSRHGAIENKNMTRMLLYLTRDIQALHRVQKRKQSSAVYVLKRSNEQKSCQQFFFVPFSFYSYFRVFLSVHLDPVYVLEFGLCTCNSFNSISACEYHLCHVGLIAGFWLHCTAEYAIFYSHILFCARVKYTRRKVKTIFAK